MKAIISILIFIILNGCKGQNPKTKIDNTSKQDTIMKTFDIETFNKNKNHLNEYNFNISDTISVSQWENKQGFIEVIRTKNDLFEDFYAYYKTGLLKLNVKRYPNSFFKGTLREYNENNELVKEENLDKPYPFSWEKVKEYLTQHEVEDFQNHIISIRRYNEPEATEYIKKGPYWELSFKGKYKEIRGQFFIELDGITGEELLVKKFKGKGASGEDATIALYDIIYEKKQ